MDDRYLQLFRSGAMVQSSQPQPKVDGVYADRQPEPRSGLQRIESMSQQEILDACRPGNEGKFQDLIQQIEERL